MNLIELVKIYGSPLYVYDQQKIFSQIEKLRTALIYRNTKLNFAVKSNSNLSILRTIQAAGLGVDCVSPGEVQLAFHAGFAKENIHFTPSMPSYAEIKAMVPLGVNITLDSLYLIESYANEFAEIPFSIRINPKVMAGAYEKISTGHAKAKFGISADHIEEILNLVNKYNLQINGLHIHSGSDILDIDQFLEAANVLMALAKPFKNLLFIDLGSGFKVKYQASDLYTDLDKFGQIISDRFGAFCKSYGKDLILYFEPGKILVSEAGKFLTTCTGTKVNGGVVFAGVDSGFNHLIRPMFYGAYHHLENLTNPHGKIQKYDVVGNICETDTFATDRLLTEIKSGDILSFSNAGAYCYSMASSYNTRVRPAEVLINGDDHYLIRRRETLEDILDLQPDPFLKLSR